MVFQDTMKYNIFEPWKTLDPWQIKYIETTDRNCFLLCGRQSGKTAAMSIKFGKLAATKKNEIIMMIAETEKQAYNLFFKTLTYLEAIYPHKIERGKFAPTKHLIHLTNGSVIMCYAAGLTGSGLRTFTLTRLVIDEAAPMAREIFIATMPMLSVTGGLMDLSSTPRGKLGFFYDASKREDFEHFYISAEDCPRHSKRYLEAQKAVMSKLEYAQEYLAQFLDDLRRVYSDALLIRQCIMKRRNTIIPKRKYYLGSDIAGLGKDLSTYEALDKISRENIEHVENQTTRKLLTFETTRHIIGLENQYKFKNIGIDSSAGGGGFGVFSELLNENSTKRKTIGLDNASRDLDEDGEKSTKLLKVDMHLNMVSQMEKGILKLLDDEDLIQSLKSVQYEYVQKEGQKTVLRIFGNDTHIAEGLIRATWCATKDKSLKVFARTF